MKKSYIDFFQKGREIRRTIIQNPHNKPDTIHQVATYVKLWDDFNIKDELLDMFQNFKNALKKNPNSNLKIRSNNSSTLQSTYMGIPDIQRSFDNVPNVWRTSTPSNISNI